MKTYIVYCEYAQWNDIYITQAKNKKDAIQKVWDTYFSWRKEKDVKNGYKPYCKKDLWAISLEDMYKQDEVEVICLH
ncbi:MAG: hypothetical protein PHT02_00825 [Tissierellia bacterium]|nr:hypothetical protein [Tissierellia bacterium]